MRKFFLLCWNQTCMRLIKICRKTSLLCLCDIGTNMNWLVLIQNRIIARTPCIYCFGPSYVFLWIKVHLFSSSWHNDENIFFFSKKTTLIELSIAIFKVCCTYYLYAYILFHVLNHLGGSRMHFVTQNFSFFKKQMVEICFKYIHEARAGR